MDALSKARAAADEADLPPDEVIALENTESSLKATIVACDYAHLPVGTGTNKALQWTRQPTVTQEKQIEQLLTKSYRSVVGRLRANRDLLDEVARLLVEKQEIAGGDLRKLVEGRVVAAAAASGNGKTRRARSVDVETSSSILLSRETSENPLSS